MLLFVNGFNDLWNVDLIKISAEMLAKGFVTLFVKFHLWRKKAMRLNYAKSEFLSRHFQNFQRN